MVGGDQRVAGHATPRRKVDRSTRAPGNNLESLAGLHPIQPILEFEDERSATDLTASQRAPMRRFKQSQAPRSRRSLASLWSDRVESEPSDTNNSQWRSGEPSGS